MSHPAFLVRYRRLLCIGVVSLSAHLLVIVLVAPAPKRAVPAGTQALAVRLASATPMPALSGTLQAALPQARPPSAAPATVPPRAQRKTPATAASAHAPQPDASTPPVTNAPLPSIVVDGPPAVLAGTDAGANQASTSAEGGSAQPVTQPMHYRLAPVPSARLAYTVRRSSPDGTTVSEAGAASLDWVNQGTRYQLRLDGVLGEMESEGDIDDLGIAPERLVEQLGAGTVTTRFDREQQHIVGGRDNIAYRLVPGSQDSLSVLAQLSAIGSADPDQMQGELAFWIGGADGARTASFRVIGKEQLNTSAGLLETMHLLRLPDPAGGDPRRLELWLALSHGWLPVQLRVTDADGAVVTQTADTIEIAPVPEF